MGHAKLTDRWVGTRAASTQEEVYWDAAEGRFGLRIRPNGTKSFVVQYRNAQGLSRRLTIGKYPTWTASAARKHAEGLLRRVDAGEDPAAAREVERQAPTVETLCLEYIAKMEAGLILGRKGTPKKASTVYCDRGRIEHQIIPLLGKLLVRDVTLGHCQKFMEALQTGKASRHRFKAKLRGKIIIRGGNGTARRAMGLLGGIFQYAVRQGFRSDNPVRGIQRPADGKRTARLDAEGYRKLYLGVLADGYHWQAPAIALLLALTGMRKGEAVKLKLSEVDYNARCLRLEDTKTGASVRPLGHAAIRILKLIEHKARDGYVFPVTERGIQLGHSGKPYAGLEKQWRRMIGLRPSPHTLRHSFASVANDLGYTRPTISALLGHSAQGVTEGYIHHLDSALIQAADKVSSAIWEMLTLENVTADIVQFPRQA